MAGKVLESVTRELELRISFDPKRGKPPRLRGFSSFQRQPPESHERWRLMTVRNQWKCVSIQFPLVPRTRTVYLPSLIKSDTRSAIIIVVTLVFARMQSGIIDASTILRF